MCGNSIRETASISLEQAEQTHTAEFHIERHASKRAVAGVSVGITLLVVGGVVLYLVGPFNPFGFIPFLVGLFALIIGINAVGSALTRPWRGGRGSRKYNWTWQRVEADKKEREGKG